MNTKFSKKFGWHSGIVELMHDLWNALAWNKNMLMLWWWNPSHIKEIEIVWREEMNKILNSRNDFEKMLWDYNPPEWNSEFITVIVDFLNKEYSWNLSSKNIAIVNWSQSWFFYLFNILAWKTNEWLNKKILLPLVPEYIWYTDQWIDKNIFIWKKWKIEYIDEHTFKYHIDFDKLKITKNISAMCISRPTNPTWNVVTDEELFKLSEIAKKNKIYLIIDNAYWDPFPWVIFNKSRLTWNENIILSMSLSKIWLPSTRTWIIIANEKMINLVKNVQSIQWLSSWNLGPYLTKWLIKSWKIKSLCQKIINPFYKEKSDKTVSYLKKYLNGDIPYYIHKNEWAFFIWLWLKNMPISSKELYGRLKNKWVIIVPWEYFFPGLKSKWKHQNECIRISFWQEDEIVKKWIKIIANEINTIYS